MTLIHLITKFYVNFVPNLNWAHMEQKKILPIERGTMLITTNLVT